MAQLSRRRARIKTVTILGLDPVSKQFSSKQQSVFSLSPVNWGVVYQPVFSLAALGFYCVVLSAQTRLRYNSALRIFDVVYANESLIV